MSLWANGLGRLIVVREVICDEEQVRGGGGG